MRATLITATLLIFSQAGASNPVTDFYKNPYPEMMRLPNKSRAVLPPFNEEDISTGKFIEDKLAVRSQNLP